MQEGEIWVPHLTALVYYLVVSKIIEAEEFHFNIDQHYNEHGGGEMPSLLPDYVSLSD